MSRTRLGEGRPAAGATAGGTSGTHIRYKHQVQKPPQQQQQVKEEQQPEKQQVKQQQSTTPATTSTPGSTSGSTGGSTGGSSGGGTTGSGGTGSATDPIKEATKNLTDGLADVGTAVTQPVVNTLDTLAQATNFCDSQIGSLLSGALKTTAVNLCAPRVQGKTEEAAGTAIPNTLCGDNGLLAWLGLHTILC